uniref:Uncharacterized protein n=1 Tax=Vitis vinifera TaxID=29760 RepID=F6GZ20_VITVI
MEVAAIMATAMENGGKWSIAHDHTLVYKPLRKHNHQSQHLSFTFISVMQAILFVGKQLQRLHIEEKDVDEKGQSRSMHSVLLRKLILTASSSGIIGNAAKLLSTLNKEAADKGDLPNLFNISSGQFPEVAKARSLVQSAKEKLDLLIGLYRKQLRMNNLEFMSVSGTTHLIKVVQRNKFCENLYMYLAR